MSENQWKNRFLVSAKLPLPLYTELMTFCKDNYSVNSVIIAIFTNFSPMLNLTVAGFLSSDPKLEEVGQTCCKLSIPARTGPKDEDPTWVKVSVWGNRANVVMDYYRKGSFTCTGPGKHRPHTKRWLTGIFWSLIATSSPCPRQIQPPGASF